MASTTPAPDSPVIAAFADALNLGNLAAVEELCTPDCVAHCAGQRGPLVGPTALQHYLAQLLEACPDLALTVEGLHHEGDTVVVAHTWRGTHHGAYGGQAPTGAAVVVRTTDRYRCAGERIAAWWTEFVPVPVRPAGGADRAPAHGARGARVTGGAGTESTAHEQSSQVSCTNRQAVRSRP